MATFSVLRQVMPLETRDIEKDDEFPLCVQERNGKQRSAKQPSAVEEEREKIWRYDIPEAGEKKDEKCLFSPDRPMKDNFAQNKKAHTKGVRFL